MRQNFYFKFLRGSRIKVLALSLLGIGASACGVYLALLSKTVVDLATGQTQGDLLSTGLQLGAVILLQLLLQAGITVLHVHTSVSLKFRLQSKLFEKLLHKQKLAADQFHSGEVVHRLSGDTAIIAEGVAEMFPALLSISARILFSFAALLLLDQVLAVVCLAAGIILFFGAGIYRKLTGDLYRKSRECEGRIRSFLQEAAQNFAVVQAFSVQKMILRLLGKAQADAYTITMKKNRISVGAEVFLSMAMTAAYYGVLAWGAWRIYTKTITFGTLTAILGLAMDISTPFQQLASLFPEYLGFCASAERLEELETLPEEVASVQHDPKDLHKQMCAIRLCDLSFSYPDTPVLNQVSGTFEKGKLTAICGTSGAGKSTMLNLMLGLLPWGDGQITAQLEDGTEVSLASYRKLFAYVPQNFLLLSGSVLENITLFAEEADLNRVSQVLQAACLSKEVAKLPQEVHTQLGEGGSRLSGGQRQRMAIARALYSGADVLLLDESTSALSADMEEQILTNLKEMGKTVIFVTHRKTAVDLCDHVFRLEDGQLRQLN